MLWMDLGPDWPGQNWSLCNCNELVEEGHITATSPFVSQEH